MSIEDENLGSTTLERITEAIEELADDEFFVNSVLSAADRSHSDASKVKRIIREVAEHVASEYSL